MHSEYCKPKSVVVVDLDPDTLTSSTAESESDVDSSTESSSFSSSNYSDLECYVIEDYIWVSKPISISELNFGKSCTKWCIVAIVSNKSNIRRYSNGTGKWFDLELTDGSGSIRAVVFDEACNMFHSILEVNKTYCFSQCKIKKTNRRYSKLPHDYELVLEKYSLVELYDANLDITRETEIERPVIKTWTLLDLALHQRNRTDRNVFHVEATILFIKNSSIDEVVYKGCPLDQCKKKVERTENAEESYYCVKCNDTYPTFEYRYMLKLLIADWTGKLWITLFDQAEQFLNISARDIVKLYKSGINHAKYESYFTKWFHEIHTFVLEAGMVIYDDENRVNGIGSCYYPTDFKASSRRVMKEIKRLRN